MYHHRILKDRIKAFLGKSESKAKFLKEINTVSDCKRNKVFKHP
jgi:hypothetical protein